MLPLLYSILFLLNQLLKLLTYSIITYVMEQLDVMQHSCWPYPNRLDRC